MKDYSLEEFGKRIKKVRNALGLTQKEFSAGIKLSHSFISDIEAGRSKACYDFFYNISKTYGVNLYYLVNGEGEMFGNTGPVHDLEDHEIGGPVRSQEELAWYTRNSPLFMHSIMGLASKFVYENEAIIKKDIEIFKSKKEKNHE